jgi:phosphinothricin acetyltransferase
LVIRDAVLTSTERGDPAAIAAIYAPYVRDTVITFEETPPDATAMAQPIAAVQQLSLPWLVAERDSAIEGYAYATRWKERSAYRFTVETTVYVASHAHRRGTGARLCAALLARLDALGIHAALGGIALPNPASVALHERLGFVHVGTLREVGFKLGRWVDVGYWERRPTRPSPP